MDFGFKCSTCTCKNHVHVELEKLKPKTQVKPFVHFPPPPLLLHIPHLRTPSPTIHTRRTMMTTATRRQGQRAQRCACKFFFFWCWHDWQRTAPFSDKTGEGTTPPPFLWSETERGNPTSPSIAYTPPMAAIATTRTQHTTTTTTPSLAGNARRGGEHFLLSTHHHHHHPSLAWNTRRRGFSFRHNTTISTPLPPSKHETEGGIFSVNTPPPPPPSPPPPSLEMRDGGRDSFVDTPPPTPPSLEMQDGVFLLTHQPPTPPRLFSDMTRGGEPYPSSPSTAHTPSMDTIANYAHA